MPQAQSRCCDDREALQFRVAFILTAAKCRYAEVAVVAQSALQRDARRRWHDVDTDPRLAERELVGTFSAARILASLQRRRNPATAWRH
ncbi:hypothetical protein ACFL5O_08070 [Myxococcota bacterium]